MPKQTLFIVSPAHLSITNNQLEINLHEPEQVFYRSFEDIERIIVDHYAVYLTVPLINRLAENNIAVVFCNEQHYPTTMLMDLDSNYVQTRHFRNQLEATLPMKKQMWKQIIESKIRNQSNLLQKLGLSSDILKPYYSNVKSGDSSNREGIAARIYWKILFGKDFIRDRIGPAPNHFLNYGYALLRSAMARAIMNAGLLPTVGIFHRSYYNSFPLADDLMEPYRPFVDEQIYRIFKAGKIEIDKEFKSDIVSIFYDSTTMETLLETTRSVINVFSGDTQLIYYPILK